jgi:hypothetical protein
MFCRLEEFLVLLLFLLWILKPGGATMHFQPLFKAQKQVLTTNYIFYLFYCNSETIYSNIAQVEFEKILDLVLIFI